MKNLNQELDKNNNTNTIIIPEKSRENILQLIKVQQELQTKVELIISTICDSNNIDIKTNEVKVSPDLTTISVNSIKNTEELITEENDNSDSK